MIGVCLFGGGGDVLLTGKEKRGEGERERREKERE